MMWTGDHRIFRTSIITLLLQGVVTLAWKRRGKKIKKVAVTLNDRRRRRLSESRSWLCIVYLRTEPCICSVPALLLEYQNMSSYNKDEENVSITPKPYVITDVSLFNNLEISNLVDSDLEYQNPHDISSTSVCKKGEQFCTMTQNLSI